MPSSVPLSIASDPERQAVARHVFGGDDESIISNVMDVLDRHVDPTDDNVDAVRGRLRAWAIGSAKRSAR